MARDFVEALRRHSLEVQRLEADHADEFLRLLKKAQEDLRSRLLGIGDIGTLDVFALRRAIAEAQVAITALEKKALGAYDKTAQESVDLAVDHLGDELDKLSSAFDARPLDVVIDARAALADPAQGLLADHFESSVKKYGHDLLNGVRQRLFTGMTVGDDFRSVVSDVASARGPLGTVGQSNAERIARTETSQAYGAAQHSAIKQAQKQVPDLKKVWLHVSSFICKTCIPLHGTERPLDGTWTIRQGKKTKEVAHAPAHPNCGCRVSSMKPSWRKSLVGLGYLSQSTEDTPAELNSV